jgi:putative tryptophan/tyrosine transport system substrate-binding protein
MSMTRPLSPVTMLLSRHTRRRDFVIMLGAAGAWPLAGEAQASTVLARIGLLFPGIRESEARVGILLGLQERGYSDGKTARIEERFAEGNLGRLPELARELVALQVDVIVSLAASATVAARQATSTTPIVMVHAGDPISHGLIESLALPGGNVTGTTSNSPELVGKSIQMMRELVPHARRFALLAVPSNTGTQLAIAEAEAAARTLGLADVMVVGVERVEEIDPALAGIEQARPDALLIFIEPMLHTNRSKLLAFAERARIPTMYQHGGVVRDGGLIGYSPLFAAHYPLAAEYVDRILKGAKPAELPVAQSIKFELVINLRAANSLGITVPLSLQAQADEVIE